MFLSTVSPTCKQTHAFTFSHSSTYTYAFAFTLRGPTDGKATSVALRDASNNRPYFFFFFKHLFLFAAGPTDEMDNCGALSDSVSHSSRKEHEDYRKGKILLGAAFYSQFVFICPPAPLGCLWERVSTCFIGRYCVSGSKSVFTHRCEWRTSVSVPLLFVSGWNYLGANGFVVSLCVGAGLCVNRGCVCVC